ncbi:MAG: hypothetical protein WAZ99_10350 [Rectinemataceae bacterium]
MTTALRFVKGNPLVAIAAAGLLSGLLYLSYALSFAFLLPVQYAFARREWKSGILAATIALLVIAAGQIVRALQVGVPVSEYFGAGTLPPFALLAAISAVNLRKGRLGTGYRILIAAAALSLLVAPFLARVLADANFSAWLVAAVSEALSVTGTASGEVAAMAGQAVAQAGKVLSYGLSLFILSLLGVSWWWGSRLALKAKQAQAIVAAADGAAASPATEGVIVIPATASAAGNDATDLSRLKLPHAFLWLTLSAWAGVLAVLVFRIEGIAAVAIWNVALCLAACFAVQGLGIVLHFTTTRWNFPRALRAGLAMLVVAGIFIPAVGLVLAAALPLLGITEAWIPYRTFKGANA